MKLGGILKRITTWMDSPRLLLVLLALLPLALSQLYPVSVDAFISDRMMKDFLFKMMGLGAIGFLVNPVMIRWMWWTILTSHFITKDALFQGDASYYLLNIGLGLILYSLVYSEERLFGWFCRGVTLSVLANLGLQFLQVIQRDPFHTFWKLNATGTEIMQQPQMACGFLGNPVSLGVYYSICLPLVMVATGRLFPFLGVLLLLGMVLTHSKIALFVAVILFILCSQTYVKEYGVRWKRLLEIGFFSFLTLIPFSLLQASNLDSAFRNRWMIWTGAMKHLVNPWIGDGLSSWNLRRFWFEGSLWPQACNEYVQVFYEMGAVGLLLILAYAVGLTRRFLKTPLSFHAQASAYSILAVAITSLFFFPLHLPQTSLPFILSLSYF